LQHTAKDVGSWGTTCSRTQVMCDDRRKNLFSLPLCSIQHEICVREKGNRKVSVALVVSHNRQQEGGSPLHPRDFAGCLFTKPTWHCLHLHSCRSKSFLTDPLYVCACACAYATFVFFFQNLTHIVASLTIPCYTLFSPFSSYISLISNTPLKLTLPVIKTPSPTFQSGLLPWLPPVSLPSIISYAALNAYGFWSKQLVGFCVTYTCTSKSLKFINTRQYIKLRLTSIILYKSHR
jgi:hypothetical protein